MRRRGAGGSGGGLAAAAAPPFDLAGAMDAVRRHAIVTPSRSTTCREVVRRVPDHVRVVLLGEATHGTKEFYDMVRDKGDGGGTVWGVDMLSRPLGSCQGGHMGPRSSTTW